MQTTWKLKIKQLIIIAGPNYSISVCQSMKYSVGVCEVDTNSCGRFFSTVEIYFQIPDGTWSTWGKCTNGTVICGLMVSTTHLSLLEYLIAKLDNKDTLLSSVHQ